MFTGTGFAQPINVAPLSIDTSGKMIVPMRSACTAGLRETRPSSRAVGSPSWSAVQACAVSCTVNENSSTMNAMTICAISMPGKKSRLRPTREKRKDGIGGFGADSGGQFLTRRAPNARDTAKRREQRLAPARADAWHMIELRLQVAHRACAAMERDREAVRFIADALYQQ